MTAMETLAATFVAIVLVVLAMAIWALRILLALGLMLVAMAIVFWPLTLAVLFLWMFFS